MSSGSAWHPAPAWHVRALMALVRAYQRGLSPILPPTCRFYPSCSQYAVEALREHGAARGCWLALRRLLRCGPWHPGGIDPVPPRRVTGTSASEDLTEHPAEE